MESKKMKEELELLGGKFNYNLKCGKGWVFSKKKLELVQKLIRA